MKLVVLQTHLAVEGLVFGKLKNAPAIGANLYLSMGKSPRLEKKTAKQGKDVFFHRLVGLFFWVKSSGEIGWRLNRAAVRSAAPRPNV